MKPFRWDLTFVSMFLMVALASLMYVVASTIRISGSTVTAKQLEYAHTACASNQGIHAIVANSLSGHLVICNNETKFAIRRENRIEKLG